MPSRYHLYVTSAALIRNRFPAILRKSVLSTIQSLVEEHSMKQTTKVRTATCSLLVAFTSLLLVAQGRDSNKSHDRENGVLAVSAVTVVDGAYAVNQIATLRVHGGPYLFLTNLPDGAFDPVFTPDGQTIFFWGPVPNAPDGIYSTTSTGGPVAHLVTDCTSDPNCLGEGNPAVSPKGKELVEARAYGPADANNCLAFSGIYLLQIDGTYPRRVSRALAPCTSDFEPRWSPQGRRVLFQHQDIFGLFSMWIMRRDGSHAYQVTPAGMDIGNPDWSPDGERIVFQSPAEPADDLTPQQIYTIHPNGSGLVQLTHYEPISGVTIGTFGSRWSPDGDKIVFAHRDDKTTIGPDGLPHADLFEMNSDGSNVRQITFSPEKDNSPAWAPER
jgi:Tol biopolymer transport system component